jgi:hypothetical protein
VPSQKAEAGAAQAGGAVRPASGRPPPKGKPVQEVRVGKVKAVIRANLTDGGLRHNVQLRRIFKRDDVSPWETTDVLGRDDCLLAAEVLRQAVLWIFEHGQG